MDRPKNVLNEEELLALQDSFRHSRIQSSVSEVIPTTYSNSIKTSCKKKSIFSQKNGKSESANAVVIDFPQIQVLKDVVEKDEMSLVEKVNCLKGNSQPEIFQRKKSCQVSGCAKSIFAQNAKKAKFVKESLDHKSSTSSSSLLNSPSNIAKAVLGETEASIIHQENLDKMISMGEENILKEQQQLLNRLSPELIAFLKKKKKSRSTMSSQLLENKESLPKQKQTTSESENFEIKEIKELTNPHWLHMDKIEKEKYHWMSSLPPIKEIQGQSYQARFDFHGNLLTSDVDLPVTTGLYHHGEEPERAGYSINELMLLSRSSKLQQRVVALNSLSKVLEKATLGVYDSSFETALLPTLLDNGTLMLLRFCLDDSSPAVVSAALVAFSRLLSNPFDEICLERSNAWHNGEEQPNLFSFIPIDPADKEQEEEMKDIEVSRVDVIKACMRMDVPLRIRYILEEIRPEAKAVVAALEILIRMARHSANVAQSIMDCPRLMDSIFRFFLPNDWQSLNQIGTQETIDNVYGIPVRQVLRLARVIASWNSEFAVKLVTRFPLLESLKIYVAVDTAQLKLPTQESLQLVIDSYHTWRLLLRQGIGVQALLDFFPALFPQLLYFQSSVSIDASTIGDSANVRFSHQLGSSMLLMMEALLSVCCHSENHQHLHIGQIRGLREIVELNVAKWASQLRNFSDPIPESAGCLLAAGIHLLATFYTHWIDAQACHFLDQLCSKYVLPLLHSESLSSLVKSLTGYSNLSSSLQSCARSPNSLPSINSTAINGELVPVLASSTPFPLLTSIFRLLRVWKGSNSGTIKVLKLKLSDDYFTYLMDLNQSTSSLYSNWFTRLEIHFLHHFLMSCAEWVDLTVDQHKVTHEAALTALASLPIGSESLAISWIDNIIFNEKFIRGGFELDQDIDQLNLDESSNNSQLPEALNELSNVAMLYKNVLFPSKGMSSTALTKENQQILPADWIYFPLVTLYQHNDRKPCDTSQLIPETALLSLRAITIMVFLRPHYFLRIPLAEHYARLSCIFLAGNNFFLEENVIDYMWPILRRLAEQQMDIARPVAGVDDFTDLYARLLDQFEAVSYGSPLYGAFLLLPLQQQHPVHFRMKLWREHYTALRIITVNNQQMLTSLDHWLYPIETDEILLMSYAASIRLGHIMAQRNPVLYQIATHHIQCYVEQNPLTREKLSV